MLTAALTIWRWGRQNAASLTKGQPLGSFEQWAEWIRDPLLTLGCADPVRRIADAKAADPARKRIAELFTAWNLHHAERAVAVSALADDVRAVADPQGRGRQWLASFLDRTKGTRMAGYVLTAEKAGGRWSATTYRLQRTDDTEPMPPMPNADQRAGETEQTDTPGWDDDPSLPAW